MPPVFKPPREAGSPSPNGSGSTTRVQSSCTITDFLDRTIENGREFGASNGAGRTVSAPCPRSNVRRCSQRSLVPPDPPILEYRHVGRCNQVVLQTCVPLLDTRETLTGSRVES